ncbi:hypothetical protein I6H96_11230 [Brucella anthropi]|uniref:Lipoprotein n=1 Tax=Brucella anthropi (strain ATCC 49188 / DSM 6882 / CCUG 24695 / JCM 21032 / LMG 3331 / NBRC 15819 / NCTC 12168 / Alc 37) TaxID=439375 RepID=A6WVI9_BRUA4|nr:MULTISPECIES: hypothetical protein [Brucella]ABS12993.1 conserved hypothetical protein [Brucella anthropi ATCC 49188]NKC48943.1 hypothetical protein [Brucella anthropi ATCC 49188]QQC24752.1 hypothetical protein I6H96_11230 [Brucella anthropi]SUA60323.1 Uncharacterised protein [Brucella anthropi]SUB56196.1 Uncharacterised protein [Brucella anthropi]
MKPQAKLWTLLALMMSALTLAGCGHSGPANVSGVRNVLGTDLLGARGATEADQRKIDRTIVRGCAGGVWSKDECAIHDKK